MPRIAIIAASEDLRAALARALRASPAFEVVGVGAVSGDVAAPADVVLVAHSAHEPARQAEERPLTDDVHGAAVLTPREHEILDLLADGLGNKQIAARLGISPHTVKTHMEMLFEKLGVSSRAEAVAAGVRRGVLLL